MNRQIDFFFIATFLSSFSITDFFQIRKKETLLFLFFQLAFKIILFNFREFQDQP